MPIEFTQESQPTGSFALNYFGARYFDPFFGLWMTPDPAGQYANPYTYGGDPVNFIDPTGLFGLNTGFFTIGWDSNRGWNFGMSAGIFSYTWYQNGSKTFEATIGGSYQWYFLNLGGSIGYSYNTYSGHSLSAGGHVCVGVKEDEAGVCAGLEAGGSMNWDAYGNFLGMTAYAGAFAELQASDNTSLVKVNGGYETGLFGMEGRGWYTGASAMDGSLYASWSQNGGWNYGFSKKVEAWNYDGSNLKILGLDVHLSLDLGFGRRIDEFDENLNHFADYIEQQGTGKDQFVFVGHGAKNSVGLKSYAIGLDEKDPLRYYGALSAEEFGNLLLKGAFGYKGESNIKLYSCETGKGEVNFASKLASYMSQKLNRKISVTAPTDKIHLDLGGKLPFIGWISKPKYTIINNGTWRTW